MFQKAHGRTYIPLTRKVTSVSSSGSLMSKINAIHRQAYGRNPSLSEHTYWSSRVISGEKKTEAALLGAMLYHKSAGIKH